MQSNPMRPGQFKIHGYDDQHCQKKYQSEGYSDRCGRLCMGQKGEGRRERKGGGGHRSEAFWKAFHIRQILLSVGPKSNFLFLAVGAPECAIHFCAGSLELLCDLHCTRRGGPPDDGGLVWDVDVCQGLRCLNSGPGHREEQNGTGNCQAPWSRQPSQLPTHHASC